MKTRTAVLILFGCLVTAGNAAADPFEVLPAGEAVFNVAATTSGVFHCHFALPCIGSGTSSVTLGSGANTATFTFHGIDSTFQVLGGTRTPVSLGTIESTGSESFIFPVVPNRPNSLGVLGLILTVSYTLAG